MAEGYTQIFTLSDIFSNPELRGVLPQIRYKEGVTETGRTSRTATLKTINRIVYDTCRSAGAKCYSPLQLSSSSGIFSVGGQLKVEYNTAYETVYNAIVAAKGMMSITANNMYMIREALKEGKKRPEEPKLFLRIGSVLEIKGMSRQKRSAFLDDVMRNIYYNPEFAETQKKYDVASIFVPEYHGSVKKGTRSPYSYEERKYRWNRKVGLI